MITQKLFWLFALLICRTKSETWLFAHVNNIVIISKHPEQFWCEMEVEFEIRYPGEDTFLLGMNIERFAEGIQINQTQYVERKLEEFGLETIT